MRAACLIRQMKRLRRRDTVGHSEPIAMACPIPQRDVSPDAGEAGGRHALWRDSIHRRRDHPGSYERRGKSPRRCHTAPRRVSGCIDTAKLDARCCDSVQAALLSCAIAPFLQGASQLDAPTYDDNVYVNCPYRVAAIFPHAPMVKDFTYAVGGKSAPARHFYTQQGADVFSAIVANFANGPAVDEKLINAAASPLRQKGEVRFQFDEEYDPGIPGRPFDIFQPSGRERRRRSIWPITALTLPKRIACLETLPPGNWGNRYRSSARSAPTSTRTARCRHASTIATNSGDRRSRRLQIPITMIRFWAPLHIAYLAPQGVSAGIGELGLGD